MDVPASLWRRWYLEPPQPFTQQLFLRALGAVHVIAFLSLWVQLDGLWGAQGITPAAQWGEWVAQRLPGLGERLMRTPTLLWLTGFSNLSLHFVCGLGVAAGALLSLGLAQRASALAAWALYLSLVTAGGVFLAFQWELLLLETGLLAVLYAPSGLRAHGPARRLLATWLLRWLLFRLMFLSGMVKLLSGDRAWRELTAFQYHYWTQPLPAWTSHFAHHLPDALHTLAAVTTFVLELFVPFFIFGPRRARQVAAAGFALLQLSIALTGNYGFFNLLTLVLCVPLLDDAAWRRLLRRAPSPPPPALFAPRWRLWGASLAALLILWVTTSELSLRLRWTSAPWPLATTAAPFRSLNSYGLFAVMTTHRPEIVVEGSDDGLAWTPYVFRWKPGPLARRPAFMQPHMPRLDWQLWFAALGTCQQNPWFVAFLERLLRGAADVRELLADGPTSPPRLIRSTVHEYRFTSPEALREHGQWWTRSERGPYCPTLTLVDGALRVAK